MSPPAHRTISLHRVGWGGVFYLRLFLELHLHPVTRGPTQQMIVVVQRINIVTQVNNLL